MSNSRRFALASMAAGATLVLIALLLHTFLCEWSLSSQPRPTQMTLFRLGPLALFVRHAGYYPRTGIVLVGLVVPMILGVWAFWLYLSSEPALRAVWRRRSKEVAYLPRENVERLDVEPNETVRACVTRLGLELPCTVADVKAAYRQKSKTLHPDRGGAPHEFIALRESYQQAVDYVSHLGARRKNGRVARLDPRTPAARSHLSRRRPRRTRWLGVAACLVLGAAIGLSSHWTAIYRSRDANHWLAIGAGAIELIALNDSRSDDRGWCIVQQRQPLIWWPIASVTGDIRSVAMPLWPFLMAVAAPTILLWHRKPR